MSCSKDSTLVIHYGYLSVQQSLFDSYTIDVYMLISFTLLYALTSSPRCKNYAFENSLRQMQELIRAKHRQKMTVKQVKRWTSEMYCRMADNYGRIQGLMSLSIRHMD
jgi:hypothetical protein